VSTPSRELLQRRLRTLIVLAALLAPTYCAFPVLAWISQGWLRWFVVALWLGVGLVLAVLVACGLRTIRALNDD
jgi:uncharacterized membrane protein (DUF485 family)